MDSTRTSNRPDQPSSEADINLLLYKTGKTVKNGLLVLGGVFTRLVRIVSALAIFLIHNGFWLLTGAVAGAGYGIYQITMNGAVYHSEMVVRANFSSASALYGTIDYFNALIDGGRKETLSEIFDISSADAAQLVNFTVKPVKSDLTVARIYRNEFLEYDRTSKIRQDTFWTRTIKYPEFKESLSNYDYPDHTISVVTRDPQLFVNLQHGITSHLSENKILQEIKKQQAVTAKENEKAIVLALEDLDSLRQAYAYRIRNSPSSEPNNQLSVLQPTATQRMFPELEVYEKMLELQEVLKQTRMQATLENNVIEILAPFNPMGKKLSFARSISERLLQGLCIAAIILVCFWLYRSLGQLGKPSRKTIEAVS